MSDIEVTLEVHTDSVGDEFYVGKPAQSQIIDLSKTTFLIFHPAEDEEHATMILKMGDKPRQSAEPQLSVEDLFLKEIARAEKNFVGGYVGLGYFLRNWRARARSFPRGVERRQEVIDRMVQSGLAEVYIASDGKEAIRALA